MESVEYHENEKNIEIKKQFNNQTRIQKSQQYYPPLVYKIWYLKQPLSFELRLIFLKLRRKLQLQKVMKLIEIHIHPYFAGYGTVP